MLVMDGVNDDCYLQHHLISVTFDCPASAPDHTDQEWRQLRMLSSIPDQKEIRDGANVGSCAASPDKKEIRDGANGGSFSASPDHTEKRWRQCWQFPSITWSNRTKMAQMLAVSQHHLIIQNKNGATVSSFAASHNLTEQRWRQCFHFRSVTWSYRTKMAPMFCFQFRSIT